MSAFLGPIHYWLYNKITVVEELTKYIVDCATAREILSQEEGEMFVRFPLAPLAEACDQTNIHGWLQANITDAESRQSDLIDCLLAKSVPVNQVVNWARQFGESKAIPNDYDARDCYKVIDDTVLCGMPCDRVKVVVQQDNDHSVWNEVEDIHAKNFNNPQVAKEIRDGFMQGLFANSPYELVIEENRYEIKEK